MSAVRSRTYSAAAMARRHVASGGSRTSTHRRRWISSTGSPSPTGRRSRTDRPFPCAVGLTRHEGGTRMEVRSVFSSRR